MKCKVCHQNSITPIGTCANIFCEVNKGKDFSSVEILEKCILDGCPSDSMAIEHDNKGFIKTVFRWDSGTFIHLRYTVVLYVHTLARFMDFWGTCLPQTKPEITDKDT